MQILHRATGHVLPVLALCALAGLFAPPRSSTVPAKSSAPSPRLRLDLRNFGYQPVKRRYLSDKEFFRTLPISLLTDDATRLVFTSANTLVAFFTREIVPPSPLPGQATAALQLQALCLDSLQGNLQSVQRWPTIHRRWVNDFFDTQSRIPPTHDGFFLVHAAARLQLYSPDWKFLRERKLPVQEKEGVSRWVVAVAPGGRVAVLRQYANDAAQDEWIDADTFATGGSSAGTGGIFTVSDHAVVEKWFDSLRILTTDQKARVLCSGGFCGRAAYPLFLTNQQILSHSWEGFAVLSVEGELLWSRRQNLRNNCDMSAIRSQDGDRFALDLECQKKMNFDNVELMKDETILVYDRALRSLIFSLPIRGERADSLALSPDGKSLAVLRGTVLDFYDLPNSPRKPD